MKKRIISFVMAFVLIVCIVPTVSISVDADVARYWPVPGHRGLSRGYYYNSSKDYHYGIDISDAGIDGATVIASMGGTVIKTYRCGETHADIYNPWKYDCQGFGTGLVIRGDDGWYYQYAHMQGGSMPDYVYDGAYIAAGSKIGRVGTTGTSTGPHLHFQIASTNDWKNTSINPLSLTLNDTSINPRGRVDECVGGEGSVFVRGWSFDEDSLSSALNIHVYIGEERHAYIYANKERPDVNNVYGCGNYHGFSETIKTELTGTQTIRVYAINIGGQINYLLYTGTVNIKPKKEDPCANGHTYTNTCDTDCNYCGFIRQISHTYSNICDGECNVCFSKRNAPHMYDNACDTECNNCGNIRDVLGHVYDDDGDAICNECGFDRYENIVVSGDSNGDGVVNARDYAILIQHLNGWPVTIHLDAADVSGDGNVNARDYALLIQYLNGWEVELK